MHKAVLGTSDAERAHQLIAASLPDVVASVLQRVDLESVRQRLHDLPTPPARARLSGADWWGALGIFLLVFLSTFPVTVPFIVMQAAPTAFACPTQSPSECCSLRGRIRTRCRHPSLAGRGLDGGTGDRARRTDARVGGSRTPCDRREAVPWVHHLVLPLTARPLPQSSPSSACRADDGLLLVLTTRTSARSTSAPQEPDHSTARYDTSRHSPFTRRQTNTIVPPGRPSCTTCSTAP